MLDKATLESSRKGCDVMNIKFALGVSILLLTLLLSGCAGYYSGYGYYDQPYGYGYYGYPYGRFNYHYDNDDFHHRHRHDGDHHDRDHHDHW